MSTKNRIQVLIGLTVVGSLSLPAREHAVAAQPPAAVAEPSATGQRERYVLLSNGQLIRGVVTEEASAYQVEQRVGVMKFPKPRVEGVFDTMEDAYQYKVDQLPERDSDERFKLARWCLNVKLTAQAREQLQKVLEINSHNIQAQAMLTSIDQEAIRIAQRRRDPEVRQTRADAMPEDGPGALDTAVIQGAKHDMGINSLPVIFDLPRPLAIKRAQEFGRYVHPLLQAYCARCHNGEYDGEFQLVPVRNRVERTPDALRANLDATLRFVDPQNPSKSELLSSMLRPHGRGPNKRPIFPGSNNQAYQVFATWVSNLRATKAGGELTPAGGLRADTGDGEGFAVERHRTGKNDAEPGTVAPSVGADEAAPAGRNPADPREFPLPFAVSAGRPVAPGSGGLPRGAGPGASRPQAKVPAPAPSFPGALTTADDDLPTVPSRPATTAKAGAQTNRDRCGQAGERRVETPQETAHARPGLAPAGAPECQYEPLDLIALDPTGGPSTTRMKTDVLSFKPRQRDRAVDGPVNAVPGGLLKVA